MVGNYILNTYTVSLIIYVKNANKVCVYSIVIIILLLAESPTVCLSIYLERLLAGHRDRQTGRQSSYLTCSHGDDANGRAKSSFLGETELRDFTRRGQRF